MTTALRNTRLGDYALTAADCYNGLSPQMLKALEEIQEQEPDRLPESGGWFRQAHGRHAPVVVQAEPSSDRGLCCRHLVAV